MRDEDFVKGLDALLDELKGLPGNIERNALRSAVLEVASFMAERVGAEAPVSDGNPPKGGRFAEFAPGALSRGFKAKRSRGAEGEVAAGLTGVFYARLVEKGHLIKTVGKYKRGERPTVGHVPPNPFIMRAFEANKEWALEYMKRAMVSEIQKRLDKLRAKMPKAGG